MGTTERVTVTLPAELVKSVDRIEKNRSRFISEAVKRELQRRRREGLLLSLEHPHAEGTALAEAGFADWSEGLPAEDAPLVNPTGGRSVRWVDGKGWVEGEK
jgi:post-segregation antitoxin (ccd killing protein)